MPLLAACETSGNFQAPQLASVIETSKPAPLPPDLQHCAQEPSEPPLRKLTAGEVERYWKTDRAKLGRVNTCYARVVCRYEAAAMLAVGQPPKSCEAGEG